MAYPFKISEAASLALHAAGLIAGSPGRLIQTREIAGRLKASEAHLSKVLQRLVRAGLLQATRGPRGGFQLTQSPDNIVLKDIYEAIEGSLEDGCCPLGLAACKGDGCVLGSQLSKSGDQLLRFMEKTSLADLDMKFQG